VSGNSHPGFAAWYPLDLHHYNGELLTTRLFPLNSSTLLNFQIMAFNCGTVSLEYASDGTSAWLNIDGSGQFVSKTEYGDYTNGYALFDQQKQLLTLGEHQYNCSPNNAAASFAKKRFTGAQFTAISRSDGWAITVYDNALQLVNRRGLKTQLKKLSTSTALNDSWQLETTDASISMKANSNTCPDGTTGFELAIDGHTYQACGNKLR